MPKRQYIVDIITTIVKDGPTAVMVVERLEEEGVLHLGYGNADIDKVVEQFKETFGTTKVTKYDRFAANRMVMKYGSQAVCGVIKLLAAKSTEKYAPVVGSLTQMEDKWVSVLNFLRTREQESQVMDE